MAWQTYYVRFIIVYKDGQRSESGLINLQITKSIIEVTKLLITQIKTSKIRLHLLLGVVIPSN